MFFIDVLREGQSMAVIFLKVTLFYFNCLCVFLTALYSRDCNDSSRCLCAASVPATFDHRPLSTSTMRRCNWNSFRDGLGVPRSNSCHEPIGDASTIALGLSLWPKRWFTGETKSLLLVNLLFSLLQSLGYTACIAWNTRNSNSEMAHTLLGNYQCPKT